MRGVPNADQKDCAVRAKHVLLQELPDIMKPRIKIDNTILSAMIILTGFLYLFSDFYPHNQAFDYLFDFLGMLLILIGALFRMSARGHKKTYSQQGESLVTTGPYTLVRNPMYLGSFLIGAGFAWVVWPWWALPLFVLLFYLRFNKQIVLEEKHLAKAFGKEYDQYCARVPRLFPSWANIQKARFREAFNFKEIFSTKEKNCLWAWPLAAVILETIEEFVVYGYTDLFLTVLIFAAAALAFGLGFWIEYHRR